MSRPTIPIDIQREIFIECGHRCAVCGVPFPLERAHIIPWSKTKDHSAENLICLCASCHEMADKDWDEKTLEIYKKRPWVLRHNMPLPPNIETAQVSIRINMNISMLDDKVEDWLRYGLAGFLRIPPDFVVIENITSGSVVFHFKIPKQNISQLQKRGIRKELQKYLYPYNILSISIDGIYKTSSNLNNWKEEIAISFLNLIHAIVSCVIYPLKYITDLLVMGFDNGATRIFLFKTTAEILVIGEVFIKVASVSSFWPYLLILLIVIDLYISKVVLKCLLDRYHQYNSFKEMPRLNFNLLKHSGIKGFVKFLFRQIDVWFEPRKVRTIFILSILIANIIDLAIFIYAYSSYAFNELVANKLILQNEILKKILIFSSKYDLIILMVLSFLLLFCNQIALITKIISVKEDKNKDNMNVIERLNFERHKKTRNK